MRGLYGRRTRHLCARLRSAIACGVHGRTAGPGAQGDAGAHRCDDADERHGTASICLCAAPLSGFRQATARLRRPTANRASAVAPMMDTRYAACEDVTLVGDHLHAHTPGAFYEALTRARGRARIANAFMAAPPRNTAGGCMSPHAHSVASRASVCVTVASAP
jgi:hypothetical protein